VGSIPTAGKRTAITILTLDAAGLHVEQARFIDSSSASPHQEVSWKISSHNLAHPYHIIGMYMSPSEGIIEEIFHTLAKQNNLPSNEPHIYTRDNNSRVGKEIKARLSPQEILKVPERIDNDKHPPEPPQMPFLNSDRPSSKQRWRVFWRMLEKTHHIILNGWFEPENSPAPYTWQQSEKASINDYNTIFKRTLSTSKIMHRHPPIATQIMINPQTNQIKKIRAHRASSKATRLFLTK